MKLSIQNIEEKLGKFFDQKIPSIINRDPLATLTEEFLLMIDENMLELNSILYAPNIFNIVIKDEGLIQEDDLNRWKIFARELFHEINQNNSFKLKGPIQIQFSYLPSNKKAYIITASHTITQSGKTIKINPKNESKRHGTTNNAPALILWDDTVFNLNKKLTFIGRRSDNDIVIDNLRVSRVHAQIQQVGCNFRIIDLDSASGTFVNGHSIIQQFLSNADLIEIADIPLIFSTSNSFHEDKHRLTRTKILKKNNSGKKP